MTFSSKAPVDESAIARLFQLAENSAPVRAELATLCQDLKLCTDQLVSAIDSQDAQLVHVRAHALKGIATVSGAVSLASLAKKLMCEEIEISAATKTELQTACDEAVRELDRMLANFQFGQTF
jgi:HPt (histidine-containing phosphotransfer) domain-containing protein